MMDNSLLGPYKNFSVTVKHLSDAVAHVTEYQTLQSNK